MKLFCKKLRDPRLSKHPTVRIADVDRYIINARFLSPLALAFFTHSIIGPLTKVWKLLVCLLIWDGAFYVVGMWPDIFVSLPVSRWQVYAVGAALPTLYWLETTSGFPITKMIFGSWLRIVITPDQVTIWRLLRFPKTILRDHAVTLGLKEFERAQDPIYQNAVNLSIIIDDSVRIKIAEIYDPVAAKDLVGNANLVLALSEGARGCDFDIDPTRLNEAPLI